MTSTRRILTVVAGVLAVTGMAGATTITSQVSFVSSALTSKTAGAGGAAQNQTVNLSQFNGSSVLAAVSCAAGHTCSNMVLTSVDFLINASVTNTGVFTDTGSATTKLTVGSNWKVVGDLTLDLNGSVLTGLAYDESTPTLGGSIAFTMVKGTITRTTGGSLTTTTNFDGTAASNGTGTVDGATAATLHSVVYNPYDAKTTQFFQPSGATATTNNRNIGSTLFTSDFLGSGTTVYNLGLNSYTQRPSNLNNAITLAGTSVLNSGTVTITYNYSYTDIITPAVPEPATMFLFGSALLGLGLLRKRSRS